MQVGDPVRWAIERAACKAYSRGWLNRCCAGGEDLRTLVADRIDSWHEIDFEKFLEDEVGDYPGTSKLCPEAEIGPRDPSPIEVAALRWGKAAKAWTAAPGGSIQERECNVHLAFAAEVLFQAIEMTTVGG